MLHLTHHHVKNIVYILSTKKAFEIISTPYVFLL